MFNAAQNTAAPASLRSSRRRQRPLSNEGSISQPKAKRLRSTLNEKTFQPPDTEASPEMEEAKRSRIATLPRRVSAETPSLHKEVVVRGRKPRATDQNSKGDGSVVLVCCLQTAEIFVVLSTNTARRQRMIHTRSANCLPYQIVCALMLPVSVLLYAFEIAC